MSSAALGPSGASRTCTSPSSSTATPPAPHGDERAEGGIADRADDQLGPGGRHPLDVERLDRRARRLRAAPPSRERRASPRSARSSPSRTAPGVALVDEPGRDGLERDGAAELRGGAAGGLRRRDEPARRRPGCPSRSAGARPRRAAASRRRARGPRPRSSPPSRCRRRRARRAGRPARRGGARGGRRGRVPGTAYSGVVKRWHGAGVPGRRRVGAEPDGEHRPVAALGRGGDRRGRPRPRACRAAARRSVTTASTASSSSRMRSERSYWSAVAEAIMSTGFAVEASGGSASASRSRVGRRQRLDPQALGLAGVGAEDARAAGVGEHRHAVAARAAAGARAGRRRRTSPPPSRRAARPACSNSASTVTSEAASSAPVCDDAARCPAAERPLLTATIGLCCVMRRAIRPKRARVAERLQVEQQRPRCRGPAPSTRRKSLPERSALSPIETNDESPIPRVAASSIAAMPSAPLWDAKATLAGRRPAGREGRVERGLVVEVGDAEAVRADQPHARRAADGRAARPGGARPSPPTSANPAVRTTSADARPWRRTVARSRRRPPRARR